MLLPRNPGESDLEYGTRVHTTLERPIPEGKPEEEFEEKDLSGDAEALDEEDLFDDEEEEEEDFEDEDEGDPFEFEQEDDPEDGSISPLE